jgi:hypothetical protein
LIAAVFFLLATTYSIITPIFESPDELWHYPCQALPITLYWRGERPTETDYSIFIHLVDENDLIVAQRDLFHGPGIYPTSQWMPNEQFGGNYDYFPTSKKQLLLYDIM